jgi:hypothetical protein
MLWSGNAFEIRELVITGVAVQMMDMASGRHIPKRHSPDFSMQAFTAERKVALRAPNAVDTPVEILDQRVKDDWISEPVRRSAANVHPLSVKNI